MGDHKAFAKIRGPDGVFYMVKPMVIIGRGPASVDIVIPDDQSISRRHIQIEFCPDLQAFEISVIGKNGIFVNGIFLRHGDRPLLLQSHSDIIVGRSNPTMFTFYLPTMSTKASKHPDVNTNTPSVYAMIGHILIAAGRPLNAEEIYERLVATRTRAIEKLGSKQVIESSIRSAICGNRHVFEIHSAYDLDSLARQCGETITKERTHAAFSVKEEYKRRFMNAHTNGTANGVCVNGFTDIDVAMTNANGRLEPRRESH